MYVLHFSISLCVCQAKMQTTTPRQSKMQTVTTLTRWPNALTTATQTTRTLTQTTGQKNSQTKPNQNTTSQQIARTQETKHEKTRNKLDVNFYYNAKGRTAKCKSQWRKKQQNRHIKVFFGHSPGSKTKVFDAKNTSTCILHRCKIHVEGASFFGVPHRIVNPRISRGVIYHNFDVFLFKN